MNIIALERGMGKTTELIKISHDTGYPIITAYPDYVRRMIREMRITAPRPIYITDVKFRAESIFKGSRLKVLIDDADMIASDIMGKLDELQIEVHTITVNRGDRYERKYF